MLFLLQTLPIYLQLMIHLNNGRGTFLSLYAKGKTLELDKLLQKINERRGLDLSDMKLYFDTCCLAWLKEWVNLQNKRLLDLEGHELRFGWHGYLWYDKVKANFNNQFARRAILRVGINIKECFL
uniref:Uncharacterized protein n=1 Tax=Micrurus spixii TaxID=129469 RepID=A0A2D4MCC1_9SAUR